MWYACAIAVALVSPEQKPSHPIELSNGVRFEPIPDWIKGASAATGLDSQNQNFIEDSVIVISAEYEADGVGSPDPTWRGKSPRSIQTSIDEKFSLANIAFWLTKPSPLTFGPVLHYYNKGDPDSLMQSGSLKHTRVSPADHNNVLTLNDISEAGQLLGSILDLDRNGTIWLAIRTLISAVTERNWEIRYLLLWIVVETIFGPDRDELSYRIAQRTSFFLSNEVTERKRIFQQVKKGYDKRSAIVHGAKLKKLNSEESLELSERLESLIRNALCKILDCSSLLQTIDGEQRDQYFEDLIFG